MDNKIHRQSGLSLIEALIALLVLSIGLVGLGALMLTSLKNVHSSAHYSVASAIALDLEELLWGEMSQTVSGVNPNSNVGLNDNGCMIDQKVNDLATAVKNEWNESSAGKDAWTDVERFKLPGFSLTVDSIDDRPSLHNSELYWKDVEVTLTWTEGRFSDGTVNEDGVNVESYSSIITIPCRPTFL